MKNKWVIHNSKKLSFEERKKYWENTHANDKYESVWSLTEDKTIRDKIVNEISLIDKISRIIIPGCGSKVHLQNQIANSLNNIDEIICTDFNRVIEIASKKNNSSKISYVERDSSNLMYNCEFDVSIIVNSVLSEDDIENRNILLSCYDSLRPNGTLIGFFPTIFCALDIANIDKSEWLPHIDVKNNSFYEEVQKIWQIFYTPLRLRLILKEAGFIVDKMEVFFCDSPYFLKHSKEYYNLNDTDIVIYELFVVATKLSHEIKKV